MLHPAEPAWIAEKAGGPDRFLNTAAAIPAAEDDDGVLRLLSDDELGKHPDPPAVLQSWLDSHAAGEILSRSEVYRAVVKSRHHPPEHLRQIPADEILSRHEPEIALKRLLYHCGRSTDRCAALAASIPDLRRESRPSGRAGMRSRTRRRGAPEFSALSVAPAMLTALTEGGRAG
ncbi:hypothetical protein ACNPQM_42355 [Streptomyces sp. NPDC056231]|uniref:hypothetical protein n=1 Tax=Streptomyces sp. NPDC056231 TaxID=3345755 RepID=UPI003AAC917D